MKPWQEFSNILSKNKFTYIIYFLFILFLIFNFMYLLHDLIWIGVTESITTKHESASNEEINYIDEDIGKKIIIQFSSVFILNSSNPCPIWFDLYKLSRRLKKFKEIRLRSKLSLGVIYGLSFRIKAVSCFPQSWV